MELKFLGRGSAFNVKEGNNSAYFIDRNELFLIDVGFSVFAKLIEKNLLKDIREINIFITHTHDDHAGSLGTLLAYVRSVLKKKVNILVSKNPRQRESIENVLKAFGSNKDSYQFVDCELYDNKYDSFKGVQYIKTEHSERLECFSLMFETSRGSVFYSGDTAELGLIEILLRDVKNLDKMYIDVTNDKRTINRHIYVEDLTDIVPVNLRNRIYVMHVNSDELIKRAEELGFKVVALD